MKSIITLLTCILFINSYTLAQSINRLSVQAGYLYGTSKLTETSTVLIALPDFDPKPGFYVGLAYEHQVSALLTSGLELTYQQKGNIVRSNYVIPESTKTYRYLGITPVIGVRLINNLRFFIGPQLNLLINKSVNGSEIQHIIGEDRRLELGLQGRVSYQFNRVGLTAGYFEGLTTYFKANNYTLTNQNYQVGLFYQINKNKP